MKRTISLLTVLMLTLLSVISSASAGEVFNKDLPEWIRLDVEFRHRFEYKDNFNFNDSVDDQDSLNLMRTRVNITWLPIENLKVFTQFQDARVANQDRGSKGGNENFMDVRQLYIEYKDLFDLESVNLSGVSVRGGRQELSYGKQRLIGGFNWSNVAQTFDAGKVMFNFSPWNLTVDAFGGVKTPNKSPREGDDLFNVSETQDQIKGYYAVWKGFENAKVEQYFINRKTNSKKSFGPSGTGELEEYTVGGRIEGKVPDTRIDYEVEAAWQGGDFGDKDISAVMAVAVLGYTFDHDWNPRFAFEFDYASGDTDASDGTRETFDNLYPTNHIHYGYMDRASLQNLNNYRFQLAAKPHKDLKLQTDLHLIYLDTPKDALYSAGRTVLRTATGTDINTHVGNELDLLAKYALSSDVSILAGYSHFFAGKFLKETGTDDDGDFAYVQTTVKF